MEFAGREIERIGLRDRASVRIVEIGGGGGGGRQVTGRDGGDSAEMGREVDGEMERLSDRERDR